MPKNNKEDSRLREIAALVARHRLHQGITPQKLRALVEDLGPTYVKLGQILSLRQDLFSATSTPPTIFPPPSCRITVSSQ